MSTVYPLLMHKLSATTEELARAAGRISHTETSALMGLQNPGSTVFTEKVIKDKLRRLGKIVPKKLKPKYRTGAKHVSDLFSYHGGDINVAAPKFYKHFGEALTGKPFSPEAAKALKDMVVLHEGFERKQMGKPKQVHSTTLSHASKSILAREHNMLSKATGAGAAESTAAMRRLRMLGGENLELRRELLRISGGDKRILQYLKPGQKIPKSVIKRIERRTPKMWETPAAMARKYVQRRYVMPRVGLPMMLAQKAKVEAPRIPGYVKQIPGQVKKFKQRDKVLRVGPGKLEQKSLDIKRAIGREATRLKDNLRGMPWASPKGQTSAVRQGRAGRMVELSSPGTSLAKSTKGKTLAKALRFLRKVR